jgi:hypothetical protein
MAGWDRSFFSETVGTSFERARMLFNSFDFIFLFLPVTLAAFAAAVRLRSSSVAVLVLLASCPRPPRANPCVWGRSSVLSSGRLGTGRSEAKGMLARNFWAFFRENFLTRRRLGLA